MSVAKIFIENEKNGVSFGVLAVGQAFRRNDSYFIKLSEKKAVYIGVISPNTLGDNRVVTEWRLTEKCGENTEVHPLDMSITINDPHF